MRGRHARRGRERFLRWYRLIPMMLLVVAFVACRLLSAGPSELGRVLYPVSYAAEIESAAERHSVDPLLVCAVIKCESGWDSQAVSSAGAVGLMQVMPSTAEAVADSGVVDAGTYDPADLTDPVTNIEYGTAYLGMLQNHLATTEQVVVAYNAGPTVVQEWLETGEVPDSISYPETRAYLDRVSAAYEGYKLCYPSGLASER